MPSRVFEDDQSIPGDERLFRRIPRAWVDWDERGNASISSAAFKDEELSVNLESVMARDGRPPEDAIRNYPDYGLAEKANMWHRPNENSSQCTQPWKPAVLRVPASANRSHC